MELNRELQYRSMLEQMEAVGHWVSNGDGCYTLTELGLQHTPAFVADALDDSFDSSKESVIMKMDFKQGVEFWLKREDGNMVQFISSTPKD